MARHRALKLRWRAAYHAVCLVNRWARHLQRRRRRRLRAAVQAVLFLGRLRRQPKRRRPATPQGESDGEMQLEPEVVLRMPRKRRLCA